MPPCSRLRSFSCLLFTCRHSALRTPHSELNSEPRTLNPHEGTHPLHCTHTRPPKTPCFPMNFTPQAAPRYIHSPNAPHCTSAPKPKNPRFPRENRTFSILAPRSSILQEVHTPLQAPLFDQSKPHVFPEKYAHHLNSVLSGSLHLRKTPCFPDPNASKTTLHPQKTKTVCTLLSPVPCPLIPAPPHVTPPSGFRSEYPIRPNDGRKGKGAKSCQTEPANDVLARTNRDAAGMHGIGRSGFNAASAWPETEPRMGANF
jgi:hypothetical protein